MIGVIRTARTLFCYKAKQSKAKQNKTERTIKRDLDLAMTPYRELVMEGDDKGLKWETGKEPRDLKIGHRS
jgi:hypothetical protein